MPQYTDIFYRFGIALVIGFLVGLQRQHASDASDKEIFAGVRTFSLISVLGCGAAMLADVSGSAWTLPVIAAMLGVLAAVAYYINAIDGDTGVTTEIATLLTFVVGALCYWEQIALSVALGVVMTVLLSIKPETHRFASLLTREDIYATLKFAVVSAIVLPVLPNQSYGPPPFDVLNPYNIWLMVVFISGISFLGFVLMKVVGARRGIGLTGLLGGIASSTAVTLSFAQRSNKNKALAKPFSLAIIIAWAVMFVRVIVVVFTLEPTLGRLLLWPMLLCLAVGGAYAGYLYLVHPTEEQHDVEFANPFELGPAIKFGLVYAVVLLVSKAAQVYFGNTGVYISSLVSGLADVDAIALSMVDLVRAQSGGVSMGVASDAIMIAALANTLFKGGFALTTGSSDLRRALLPGMVLLLITGAAAILLM